MEGFFVSAATGALKAVTMKLATLLGDEFKNLMKDARKEMEPLSKELNYMHSFLENMSEEENLADHQDRVWMTDVREISYDIEDSLDEFLICLNDDKSAKKKGPINKCKKLVTKMKAHQRMSKAIQEFKTQIKEVGDRNQRYRTGASVMSTRDADEMVDIRALVIFNEASQLVGIDQQKNELIGLLTEDRSSSWHQLKVVSIVGIGGLGKTTLANQAYRSLKDTFECHAFVTVSQNPDMIKLLRTILSDISRQNYSDTEAGDVQHLIQKISDFLQDKRYFIVVDDLWDTKSWEEAIKYAFIKNTCGSRIITTTRINEVAESCTSSNQGHIYTLCPLNRENSRSLFLKRVFGSSQECPSHLTEVSDDILKKCNGLPLAIISIAGLLARKAPTLDEWNKVQTSFGYALERQSEINRMIQILSLSYFDLPPHLRSFLLYLSIFPEDYYIEKNGLMLRWIAEGFVHEEQGSTQYELGERCFNELINRSLIQPVVSSSGTPIACEVHDTILEFIVSKATEENFITLSGVPNIAANPLRKIRRLSLHSGNKVGDGMVDLLEGMMYSHTRTFSVFPGSLYSRLPLNRLPSLKLFKHLRVLVLEGFLGLQANHLPHLGGLFALRYLSFYRTQISKCPEGIGELQYLQTLDVRLTEIRDLPSSVVRLPRLVNLFCDYGLQLPDGFGDMQALQWLEGTSISSQLPYFTQELYRLRNLRKLDASADKLTQDLVTSLCTLGTGGLNSLILRIKDEACKNLVIEPWRPTPLGLKLLEILWCVVPAVPRWIGSLDNLQNLSIRVDRLGQTDVGLLGRLHALSDLRLWVRSEVAERLSSSQQRQRVKISSAHGFRSLRKFHVGAGKCAIGLLFEASAMPKLQELGLQFCELRTGYLTNGKYDFGIEHLPCLAVLKCHISYSFKGPAWDAIKAAVRSNPNHPKLYLESSPFL